MMGRLVLYVDGKFQRIAERQQVTFLDAGIWYVRMKNQIAVHIIILNVDKEDLIQVNPWAPA